MKPVSIRLSHELEAKLKAAAASISITPSELARKILSEGVERKSDPISGEALPKEHPTRKILEHLLRGVIGIEMMVTKSLDPSKFVPQDEAKKAALIDILQRASEATTGILEERDKK
jgi:hypothetical protein